MSKNETGGAAFPMEYENEGMTLRDYFAAKAMQALIATVGENASKAEEPVCGMAYIYADMMLKKREIFYDYEAKGEDK